MNAIINGELVELDHSYIRKLAMSSPIVHTFLAAHRRGDISYEDSLIAIIAYLSVHNEELIRINIDRFECAKPLNLVIDQ